MSQNKIRKLELQIQAEKKKIEEEEKNKHIALNKLLIGKSLKSIKTYNNSVYIKYINILDYVRYQDGGLMYGLDGKLVSENIEISFSNIGWFLYSGRLAYKGVSNRIYFPAKKHYTKDTIIGPNNRYDFGYFTAKSTYRKKGKTYIVDTNDTVYEFCDKQEVEFAKERAIHYNSIVRQDFLKLINDKEYKNAIDPVNITPNIANSLVKILGQYNVTDHKTFKQVAKLANSLDDFTTYDSKGNITELAQYEIDSSTSKTGLHLEILGKDDGTDYEPYITHYVIENVSINWKQVLYNIRTKIDCTVAQLADELSHFSKVYDPSNWYCEYFGDYDVVFIKASLYQRILDEVNNIIRAHFIN